MALPKETASVAKITQHHYRVKDGVRITRADARRMAESRGCDVRLRASRADLHRLRQHERNAGRGNPADAGGDPEHLTEHVVGDGVAGRTVARDAAAVEDDDALGKQRRKIEIVQITTAATPRSARRRVEHAISS